MTNYNTNYINKINIFSMLHLNNSQKQISMNLIYIVYINKLYL